jgi:hypothetical protein
MHDTFRRHHKPSLVGSSLTPTRMSPPRVHS